MSKKEILLFGSGMMSQSVVAFLNKRTENFIVIASNLLEDAKTLAGKYERCSAELVDVSSEADIERLLKTCDIAISLVPAPFHPNIARACIKHKKHLITSSYISPEMRALDTEAKNNDLIFLNECGLDPGLDHIITMKLLEQIKGIDAEQKEFLSYCGGLVSPDACDNPLGYKFSWSPVGALNALNNDAKYIVNGMEMNIPADSLLYMAKPMSVNMAFNLEGYPNRDSTKYIDLYGLHDFTTVVRGTFRYQGFSFLMSSIKEMGLFKKEVEDYKGAKNFSGLINYLLKDVTIDFTENYDNSVIEELKKVADKLDVNEQLVQKLTKKCLDIKHYPFKKEELIQSAQKMIQGLKGLGFFEENNLIDIQKSPFHNLCSYLEQKLKLHVIFQTQDDETDCVILYNEIRYKQNNYEIVKRGTLTMIGEKKGFTAMATTVGGPAAIATQLVLDGKIKARGVHLPNQKEIYDQIYEKCRNQTSV